MREKRAEAWGFGVESEGYRRGSVGYRRGKDRTRLQGSNEDPDGIRELAGRMRTSPQGWTFSGFTTRTHALHTATTTHRYDADRKPRVSHMDVSEEDLAAFNSLVQDGLIEVVRIEDGMPYYRIASEFAGPLEATGPGS